MDHGVSWCFGTSVAPSTKGRSLSASLVPLWLSQPLRLGGYAAGLTSTRRFGGSTYG